MKFTDAAALLLLQAAGSTVLAAPLETRQTSAADIIAQISPNSVSCANAANQTECRTNVQAAQPLIDAMVKYNVRAPGSIAGVISLMAFESVDFEFKHNVSPGRPGQGTANMQMFNFNQLYAQSIPELAPQVAALAANGNFASDADKNALLALVTPDQYNFGSGPWFLTTQCSTDVQNQLATGTDAGFTAYMGCVGTSVTSDRLAYWTRAKAAFNLSG